MSQLNQWFKSYTAGAAVPIFRTVKKSGDNVVVAATGDDSIGVSQNGVASGGAVTVKLWGGPGTYAVTCNGTLAANTVVYQHSLGKVGSTDSGGVVVGTTDAAAATDNAIEVMPVSPQSLLEEQAHITDYTVTATNLAATVTGNASYRLNTLTAMATGMAVGAPIIDKNFGTLKATNNLIITDLNSIKTALNAVLAALEANQIVAAS